MDDNNLVDREQVGTDLANEYLDVDNLRGKIRILNELGIDALETGSIYKGYKNENSKIH